MFFHLTLLWSTISAFYRNIYICSLYKMYIDEALVVSLIYINSVRFLNTYIYIFIYIFYVSLEYKNNIIHLIGLLIWL